MRGSKNLFKFFEKLDTDTKFTELGNLKGRWQAWPVLPLSGVGPAHATGQLRPHSLATGFRRPGRVLGQWQAPAPNPATASRHLPAWLVALNLGCLSVSTDIPVPLVRTDPGPCTGCVLMMADRPVQSTYRHTWRCVFRKYIPTSASSLCTLRRFCRMYS